MSEDGSYLSLSNVESQAESLGGEGDLAPCGDCLVKSQPSVLPNVSSSEHRDGSNYKLESLEVYPARAPILSRHQSETRKYKSLQ